MVLPVLHVPAGQARGGVLKGAPRKSDPNGTCRKCDAPVLWGKTHKGKSIALDPEPVQADADVFVAFRRPADGGGFWLSVEKYREAEPRHQGAPRRLCHWDTCPAKESTNAG